MNPGVPAVTLGEFIAYCKANPGKVIYGSSGVGTSRHLAGEIFNDRCCNRACSLQGIGPANAALLDGEISVIFEGLGSSALYLHSGKFRGPPPHCPQTLAEGGLPGFGSLSWYGLWAPVGTPRDITTRLRAEVARAFEAPDMKDAWFRQGAEPGGESSEQFAIYVRNEVKKWGGVVRANNIVLE